MFTSGAPRGNPSRLPRLSGVWATCSSACYFSLGYLASRRSVKHLSLVSHSLAIVNYPFQFCLFFLFFSFGFLSLVRHHCHHSTCSKFCLSSIILSSRFHAVTYVTVPNPLSVNFGNSFSMLVFSYVPPPAIIFSLVRSTIPQFFCFLPVSYLYISNNSPALILQPD